jgi:hypothetical protein
VDPLYSPFQYRSALGICQGLGFSKTSVDDTSVQTAVTELPFMHAHPKSCYLTDEWSP